MTFFSLKKKRIPSSSSSSSVSVFSEWEKLERSSISPVQKRDRFNLFSTLFAYTPHPNCGFCQKPISLFANYLIYLDNPPTILCEKCDEEHSQCNNCMALIPFSQYTETIPFCKFCKKNTQCHCCLEFFLSHNVTRILHTPGIFCQSCLDNYIPCIFCKKYKREDSPGCASCAQNTKPTAMENIAVSLFKKILCSFPFPVDFVKFPQPMLLPHPTNDLSQPIFVSRTSLQLYCIPNIPLHFFVMQATLIWYRILIEKSIAGIVSSEILNFTSTFLTYNFLRENNIHIRNCLLTNFLKIFVSKEFALFQRLSRELGLPKLLETLQKDDTIQEAVFD